MEHVKKAYFLCATPRSGSTLLCGMLTRAQVVGQPASYFRRQDISKWAEQFGLSVTSEAGINKEYLDAVSKAGSSANGVFGARIMWDSMAEVSDYLEGRFSDLDNDVARIKAVFGDVVYVYLSRKDVIGQAVSLAKALQTGLWHLHADGSIMQRSGPEGLATFDAALLDSCLLEIQENDKAWRSWFRRENIKPLEIVYEELIEDSRSAVGRVLAALGQDSDLSASIEPGTSRMADSSTEEWVTRYLKSLEG